jgi:hypothetical protein
MSPFGLTHRTEQFFAVPPAVWRAACVAMTDAVRRDRATPERPLAEDGPLPLSRGPAAAAAAAAAAGQGEPSAHRRTSSSPSTAGRSKPRRRSSHEAATGSRGQRRASAAAAARELKSSKLNPTEHEPPVEVVGSLAERVRIDLPEVKVGAAFEHTLFCPQVLVNLHLCL